MHMAAIDTRDSQIYSCYLFLDVILLGPLVSQFSLEDRPNRIYVEAVP